MQSLEVISLNIWQIIISLCNLIIIFLILKKFLYKPVTKMLSERKSTVDRQYAEADAALKQAQLSRDTYDSKLQNAQSEADDIIKTASDSAQRRSEQIVDEAKSRAEGIVRKAQTDAELEKKKAEAEVKREIAGVSAALSEKLLEREIRTEDHRALIDSFIEKIGDENDAGQ